MLNTRQATDNDLDFLARLYLCAMRIPITAARGFWDEAKERENFGKQLQLDQTYIISRSGMDVGFFMTVPCGEDIELHTLCVAPEHQRQGIGTAITRQIVEEAVAEKRGVVLSVLKVNGEARSLYERLGFAVSRESTYHYRMRFVSSRRA